MKNSKNAFFLFQETPPKEEDKINLQATEEVSTIVSHKTHTRQTSGILQGSIIEEQKEPHRALTVGSQINQDFKDRMGQKLETWYDLIV